MSLLDLNTPEMPRSRWKQDWHGSHVWSSERRSPVVYSGCGHCSEQTAVEGLKTKMMDSDAYIEVYICTQ